MLPTLGESPILLLGPGPGVRDEFRAIGLSPRSVLLTGGYEEGRSEKYSDVYHIPRRNIITGVQLLVQNQQLRYPRSGMPLAETLLDELRSIKHKDTPSGYPTFVHREGDHDDLVLAVAIAIWQAQKFFVSRPSSSEEPRDVFDPRPFKAPASRHSS
jgi:hypothetical protein